MEHHNAIRYNYSQQHAAAGLGERSRAGRHRTSRPNWLLMVVCLDVVVHPQVHRLVLEKSRSPGTKRDQRALPGTLSINLVTIIHASHSDSAVTVPVATAAVCFGEGSHFQDQRISLMSGAASSLETSFSIIKLVDPNHQT